MADALLIVMILGLLLVIRAQRRNVRKLRRTIKDAAWSRRGRKRPRRAKDR
jgi:hypothetical protein